MSEEDGEQTTIQSIEWCTNLQCLIEISAQHLEGLRTQCLTSAVLTQQEIRRIEGKLVKLFSSQLLAKTRIPVTELEASGCDGYPSLQLWLKVVGLSPPAIQMVCVKYGSLELLVAGSEAEWRPLLATSGSVDEVRRLSRAMRNLKQYTELQLAGDRCSSPDLPLYWDSWDASSPSLRRRPRSSVSSSDETQQSESSAPTPSESSCHSQTQGSLVAELSRSLPAGAPSPPRTPPSSRPRDGATPSVARRHQTGLQETVAADPATLTKSRSHESQLTGRGEGDGSPRTRRDVELVEGSEMAPSSASAGASPAPAGLTQTPTKSSSSLQVPRSPHTPTLPGSMSHMIAHKFAKTFKVSTCDFCKKQMIYGLRCRECRYKCHRHCEEQVPPSCGLPPKFVDFFIDQVHNQGNASPLLSGKSQSAGYLPFKQQHRYTNSSISIPAFQGHDSSSNTSSCNSSAPSSPAFPMTTPPPISASRMQQFHFPEVPAPGDARAVALSIEPVVPTVIAPPPQPSPPPPPPTPASAGPVGASHDSDKTVSQNSASTSTDSERTVASRLDSQDSTVSDTDGGMPRQNSLSLREWDIPFEEVRLGEVIGRGRFGEVRKGHWHGEVAVKLLNMDDDQALEQFRRDVATFRKTRHENLVLFMGACMCPPQLAIITSFCKGKPLYMLLHVHKEKFNLTKISSIAKHISLGMGYLHARGIVHKDLKSKNIFVDGAGTVVITDFGLFSLTKLCPNSGYRDRLHIPKGWLCYLSPEIVRSLRLGDNRDLPFTMSSDVFAFGTVWYELLSGEWPWKEQPAEATIWLVGRGMKQSLANIQASRDVKDLLMKCWNYRVAERPDFTALLTILERLPKKRLARSPSQPIQLSRSVESVF